MDLGDKIRGAISAGVGADPITKALAPPAAKPGTTGDFVRPNSMTAGHVTSGMDQAMRDHADSVHPVKASKPKFGGTWD